MRQVVSSTQTVQKILGRQKVEEGILYRLSAHCMLVERPEGVLLYHTLTGELLLLSAEEAAALGKLPGPVPPALGELAARWFLRPLEADDTALADQVREIAGLFVRKKETALTTYSIFTTTACNARCFYCFEAGWEKSSMTERTALDTAKYIADHCGGKPVRLSWFGGEPLVNTRAIDVITERLRQEGAEFHSTMTSNGYLFDEALIQQARDNWNLRRVQITLDGTEDVYNQRKAYVNPQGSPYQRVLRNIGLLLDAGVRVTVRLNMDGDNESDLYALADELAERFGGKPDFGVYLSVLYENRGPERSGYTEVERGSYARGLRSMQAYLEGKGIATRPPLRREVAVNSCMADSGDSTTVTPEGLLGRCEGCMNGSVWGSIYFDEMDEEVLRQWKERKPPEAACGACPIYPQCVRLKKCPNWSENCTPIKRARREEKILRGILGSYEEWKAGQSARIDTE